MQRILITGAGGMLGSDLVNELSRFYEVIGLAREKLDVTDRTKVFETLQWFKPSVVVHAAAYTDVDGSETQRSKARAVNVDGTVNVGTACEEIGALFLFFSTDYVFDGEKAGPYEEDDERGPLNYYGQTKLEAEEAIRAQVKRYVILRTSWLYGENGPNFVDKILARMRTETELRVVSDQVGAPTYTVDLAQGVHRLLNRLSSSGDQGKEYCVFHVTNSGQTSWFGVAEEIVRYTARKDIRISPIRSEELDRLAKRPKNSVLDNRRYEQIVGEPLRHWKEALLAFLNKRKAVIDEVRAGAQR